MQAAPDNTTSNTSSSTTSIAPTVNTAAMDPWELLGDELDCWANSGKQASLWWRDDDATTSGEKLDRLLAMTRNTGLLLAVIPATADSSLVSRLVDAPWVWVAQHGYAHINHAPRGQGLGAWELGLHRDEAIVRKELQLGRELLQQMFEDSFLPVVVPPWNHIDYQLCPYLADSEYVGVSLFGARNTDQATGALVFANAHCDPIRWKTGAVFAGEKKTMQQLLTHLAARRTNQVPQDEPTGFLTHHIDLDDAGWQFSERLAVFISEHAGATWLSPTGVFGRSK